MDRSTAKQAMTATTTHYSKFNISAIDAKHWALFGVFILCIGPWLLNILGLNFASQAVPLVVENQSFGTVKADALFLAVAGGVHHALLEWSAVTIAFLTAVASFTHYSIKKDVTIPIIGMALFSAGMVDAFHTLAATRIIQANAPNTDFIPFTWAISRIFNAGIMIIGVLLSMWIIRQSGQSGQSGQSEKLQRVSTIVIFSSIFVAFAYLVVHQAAISSSLPRTMYLDAFITRPFDVLPLAMFMMGGTLVWFWYQQRQSIVRWALFISIFPEIATQVHMAFGSIALFDNHFNIAHFLKNIAYASIFFGILIDLVKSVPKQIAKERIKKKAQASPVMQEKLLQVGRAKRPLSIQISIAAFVLSMTVASIVGFVFYDESKRLAIETNQKFLTEKNRQIKAVIGALYKEAFDHLTFVSRFPPLQRIAQNTSKELSDINEQEHQDLASLYQNFLETRIIYTGIRYIDITEKREIVSVVKKGGRIQKVDKAHLKNYQKIPFHNQLSSFVPGKAFFSEIKRATESASKKSKNLTFEIALPISDRFQEQPVGLVIIAINFNRFMQIIDSLALKDIDLFLANKQGEILYSANKLAESNTAKKEFGKNHLLKDDFPSLTRISNTTNTEPEILETERFHQIDMPIYSLYQSFQNNQFGHGHQFKWLIQPSSNNLMDELQQIENRSLLISFGLAFIALALSLVASRKLIHPLSQMISAMGQNSSSHHSSDLPLDATDETGVLARSFYNMQVLKRFKDKQVEEHQFALDQHAIVSATDLDGKILFANSKFEKVSGYSRDELIGQNHRILNSRVHDSTFFKNMYKTLSNGTVWHAEICNRSKTGEFYWVDSTIVPLLNDQGAPYQYISIRSDITEKKEAEKQLVRAKEKAERAVHSKSEFFASMSHEIRTPMNGVLGMLGLMMRTELNKQQKHYATLARSSADSLLAIIDDILDLSKIDAGKIELEKLDFNLREQLGIFAESMAYRAQDKGLEIVLNVTDIEQSMVRGDPSRLRQILSNLVGNAIKFTEKGEITITASLKPFDNKEWIFHCQVTDTGMGIPADKIDTLFDTYSQVDSSTTRKFGGTGLGLAIVKQLSQLMNGDVKLTSQFGKGSQFKFEIRLGVSELSQLVAPKQDIQGKKILVVDDNQTNLEVLIGQLEHWGAETESATSAQQALSILQKKQTEIGSYFDIAILDMGMPDMDGAELGKIIRDNHDYDALKLVMMTSMAGSGDISKFKNIGFSAYFPKPATTSDLFHALQVLVENGNTLSQMDGMVTNYNISNMTSSNIFSNALVLLVEDNPINQEVAIGILDDMGVTVEVAENGLQAIEKLKNHQKNYGLVIMDCQMPEMDGYEATRKIRSNRHQVKDSKIPIVAMTANALKGDRQKCLDAGMDDYLSKPVDPNELEEKLRHWLPKDQQDHHLLSTMDNPNLSTPKADERLVKEAEPVNLSEKNEIPVWDQASLLARVRNNEKLSLKLIALFLQDLPSLSEDLQESIKQGDSEQVTASAHRIKGSAANLSAIQVSETAAKIEMFARESDLISSAKQMGLFSKQVAELLIRLEHYQNRITKG